VPAISETTALAEHRKTVQSSILSIFFIGCIVVSIAAGCVSNRDYNEQRREQIVTCARKMLGSAYTHAGQDKDSGFDCSGLTQVVYADAGMKIPRTAKEQYAKSRRISRRHIGNGDLVFFSISGRGATHVGIYIGGNKFIHAPSSGRTVQVSSFDDEYWSRAFYGAGTYFF
jgi:cell wall-associated NlpC family hydrolase